MKVKQESGSNKAVRVWLILYKVVSVLNRGSSQDELCYYSIHFSLMVIQDSLHQRHGVVAFCKGPTGKEKHFQYFVQTWIKTPLLGTQDTPFEDWLLCQQIPPGFLKVTKWIFVCVDQLLPKTVVYMYGRTNKLVVLIFHKRLKIGHESLRETASRTQVCAPDIYCKNQLASTPDDN